MSREFPPPSDLEQTLALADKAWRSGSSELELREGLAHCERALDSIREAGDSLGRSDWPMRFQLARGHLLDALGQGRDALQAYQAAIDGWLALEQTTPGRFAVERAGAWMNLGNVLQKWGTPGTLTEAVQAYDHCVALLTELKAEITDDVRNVLGAALMNRGCTQHRRGGESGLVEAVGSLDEAIATLQPLATTHDPACRNLAFAWTNRGLVCLERGDLAGAVEAHRKALAVSDRLAALMPSEREGMTLNLGHALLAAADEPSALAAFRSVIAATSVNAATDPMAADSALKARHVVAYILIRQLESSVHGEAETHTALLAEVGDHVDDGLALARSWEGRGGWFRDSGVRLYELGAWLYRTRQPQFLAEFLQEYLDVADPERVRVARAAVTLARHELIRGSFAAMAGEGASKILTIMEDLRALESRLPPEHSIRTV